MHLAGAVRVWQAGGMRQLNSKPHPRVFTPEERSQWVSRFRSSGLPQAQFARRHGLKLTTLQKWLYGRGSRPAPMRKPSAPGDHSHRIDRTAVVIHRKSQRAPNTTFREVTLPTLGLASPGWAAEVTWPSGVTVRLGARAEAAWIGALLEAVRRAC